ncbi:hypothetical protein CAEBREN_14810 [Caenorhabditis brenneri]|uniref:LITAF domain-containing protein n=1 Tax=Caenorhabditis brenneri TaxID=135651 RepID=G0NAN2_CAEBE|nr:hypothetical protein CAEBREN_14810 [Caenorhabditis brenneri]
MLRILTVFYIWTFLKFGYSIDYKVSVLIVAEPNHDTFQELKVSVTNAFVEVFGSTSYHLGNDTISAAFVDAKNGVNRLELTQDIVCNQMLNSSLASVIFSPSLTSSARFLDLVLSSAYTLSFYKLPVVGVMVRDAEFSKKNIYPTFVRPTAPLSDEAFVQRYIEVELNENLNDTLAESFEEVTSNIILLFAKKDDAVRIFANAGDLTGKGKVWIVSESAGEAHNVPNGSLGCRLGQTAFSVLRDSFSILKSAMEKIFKESKIDIFPPVECDRDSVDAEWSTIQAPALLNEICGTSTTRVHFNDQCERIGVEYDIINFHMERKQVGNMVGDLLRLDEDSIEWAGGSKPLEISLPKHLRVVTVADPPFVYTTPVTAPSQCRELGNTVVEWSIFDKIVVIPRDSPMQSFLQPLQSSLWTALFISVILVGLAIYCLDFKSPFERFYQADKEMDQDLKKEFELWIGKDADENVNFGEAMWFVWGVLLNSGVSEKTPRSCSARVLGIVWCGFCMIMVASYTANLAAFLVLDQPEKGLTGVTDPRLRNPSANFSFGTVLNSNVYQYFKRHVELSSMFRKMEPHNVHRASEAVHSLLNGSLDAFIWDSTRLEFEAARHCELRTRGSLFGRSAYGIGLQKNSPWTPHITSAILRMSESGVMENLDQKWIDRGGPNCVVEAHKSPARLGLVNMKDIFILVSSGVALGIFFSFVEVSYGRWLADKGRRRIIVQRYFHKWHDLSLGSKRRPYRLKYNLDRQIIRRGFSGLERCSFQEMKERRQIRGLPTSRIDQYCFWPDLDFRDKPLVLFCSRCRNIVESDVHRETGLFAFLSCFLFAILFLWPCSPLPCFLSSFSDFVHICPLCSHTIGRFRRARSTRFYV